MNGPLSPKSESEVRIPARGFQRPGGCLSASTPPGARGWMIRSQCPGSHGGLTIRRFAVFEENIWENAGFVAFLYSRLVCQAESIVPRSLHKNDVPLMSAGSDIRELLLGRGDFNLDLPLYSYLGRSNQHWILAVPTCERCAVVHRQSVGKSKSRSTGLRQHLKFEAFVRMGCPQPLVSLPSTRKAIRPRSWN